MPARPQPGASSVTASFLHVFLCTIGSAGDVNPFVAIGRELATRGHRVTLVTSAYFEPLAKRTGLNFIGLGTAEDYRNTVDDPDLWDSRTGFRVFARRVVIPAIQPLYYVLSQNLAPNVVLVAQGQAFGAHLAHERHGLPFVTVHLQPVAFRSIHDASLMPAWIPRGFRHTAYALLDRFVLDREFAPALNSIRSTLGLPAVRGILASWAHSPLRSIGLFPDWFAPPQPDWPPHTSLTGFVFLDEEQRDLQPDLLAFLNDGEPPIVFTPGTAMRHADRFFDVSIRASTKLHRRAVLLTQYPEQLPSSLPPSVTASTYAPFSKLLPRAAALVHHGGIGTAASALAAGIPQLVRPMTFDQPDNALRLTRLGVAATVTPRHYDITTVTTALDSVLQSETIAANCRTYSSKIDSPRGITLACNIIEEVARFHQAA